MLLGILSIVVAALAHPTVVHDVQVPDHGGPHLIAAVSQHRYVDTSAGCLVEFRKGDLNVYGPQNFTRQYHAWHAIQGVPGTPCAEVRP